MSKVIEKAYEVIAPVAETLGYEVVEISYEKLYGEDNLTVYIYKKGGVSLSDCEKMNAALDSVLEENDVSDGKPYVLNISSPGLDRLVVTEDDFRRSLDTELELIFLNPIGKRKKTSGVLLGYDASTLTVAEKGKECIYQRNNLKQIRPYIKFK